MKHYEFRKCQVCNRVTPTTKYNGQTMCRRCGNTFFRIADAEDPEIGRILDELLSRGRYDLDKIPDDTLDFDMDVDEGIVYGMMDDVPEDVVLPLSTKVIANNAFEDIHIKNVKLNTGLLVIGEWSFAGTDIQNISLPDTLTTIGAYAFLACSLLESCGIPESVKFDAKAYHIFDLCNNLRKLSLPSSWLKEDGAVLDKVIGDSPARALTRIAQNRCPFCGDALNHDAQCKKCRDAYSGTYNRELSGCLKY